MGKFTVESTIVFRKQMLFQKDTKDKIGNTRSPTWEGQPLPETSPAQPIVVHRGSVNHLPLHNSKLVSLCGRVDGAVNI